jgi:hypothetical protein
MGVVQDIHHRDRHAGSEPAYIAGMAQTLKMEEMALVR